MQAGAGGAGGAGGVPDFQGACQVEGHLPIKLPKNITVKLPFVLTLSDPDHSAAKEGKLHWDAKGLWAAVSGGARFTEAVHDFMTGNSRSEAELHSRMLSVFEIQGHRLVLTTCGLAVVLRDLTMQTDSPLQGNWKARANDILINFQPSTQAFVLEDSVRDQAGQVSKRKALVDRADPTHPGRLQKDWVDLLELIAREAVVPFDVKQQGFDVYKLGKTLAVLALISPDVADVVVREPGMLKRSLQVLQERAGSASVSLLVSIKSLFQSSFAQVLRAVGLFRPLLNQFRVFTDKTDAQVVTLVKQAVKQKENRFRIIEQVTETTKVAGVAFSAKERIEAILSSPAVRAVLRCPGNRIVVCVRADARYFTANWPNTVTALTFPTMAFMCNHVHSVVEMSYFNDKEKLEHFQFFLKVLASSRVLQRGGGGGCGAGVRQGQARALARCCAGQRWGRSLRHAPAPVSHLSPALAGSL